MATTQEQVLSIGLQRMAHWAYEALSNYKEGDSFIGDLNIAYQLLQVVKLIDSYTTMNSPQVAYFSNIIYQIGGYGETDENAILALLSNNTLTDFLASTSLLTQIDNPQTGDILYFNKITGKWHTLPVGNNGQYLAVDGQLLTWRDIPTSSGGGDDNLAVAYAIALG